ncbi:hypothetical protein [Amycolatopsis australiensis]|uniref:hypothetical protein n=1 Tax=Amycolatopsis australiensis TaxID=546364 RepID=UPI0015A6DE35|nr:hypothetical protein [Amycolatopsis australiensis]
MRRPATSSARVGHRESRRATGLLGGPPARRLRTPAAIAAIGTPNASPVASAP